MSKKKQRAESPTPETKEVSREKGNVKKNKKDFAPEAVSEAVSEVTSEAIPVEAITEEVISEVISVEEVETEIENPVNTTGAEKEEEVISVKEAVEKDNPVTNTTNEENPVTEENSSEKEEEDQFSMESYGDLKSLQHPGKIFEGIKQGFLYLTVHLSCTKNGKILEYQEVRKIASYIFESIHKGKVMKNNTAWGDLFAAEGSRYATVCLKVNRESGEFEFKKGKGSGEVVKGVIPWEPAVRNMEKLQKMAKIANSARSQQGA